MDAFEYATGLFAIVIGLAIGDMGMSLHKLLGCRGVRWGYRPIAAAVLVAIIVSGMWFQLWSIRELPMVRAYPFYASLIVELFLVFLMAAAVFPDDTEDGMDLVAAYEGNARRIWTLTALYQTSYLAHGLYFMFSNPRFAWDWLVFVVPVYLTLILAPAAMAIWPRAAWLHRIAITAMIAFFLWDYSTASLR